MMTAGMLEVEQLTPFHWHGFELLLQFPVMGDEAMEPLTKLEILRMMLSCALSRCCGGGSVVLAMDTSRNNNQKNSSKPTLLVHA